MNTLTSILPEHDICISIKIKRNKLVYLGWGGEYTLAIKRQSYFIYFTTTPAFTSDPVLNESTTVRSMA